MGKWIHAVPFVQISFLLALFNVFFGLKKGRIVDHETITLILWFKSVPDRLISHNRSSSSFLARPSLRLQSHLVHAQGPTQCSCTTQRSAGTRTSDLVTCARVFRLLPYKAP